MKCGNKQCGYRSGDICQECNNASYIQGSISSSESCPAYIPASSIALSVNLEPYAKVIEQRNEEIRLLQNELNTQKLEIATLHENLKQQSKRATTIIETKEQEITDLKLEILTLQNKPINSHDRMEI